MLNCTELSQARDIFSNKGSVAMSSCPWNLLSLPYVTSRRNMLDRQWHFGKSSRRWERDRDRLRREWYGERGEERDIKVWIPMVSFVRLPWTSYVLYIKVTYHQGGSPQGGLLYHDSLLDFSFLHPFGTLGLGVLITKLPLGLDPSTILVFPPTTPPKPL